MASLALCLAVATAHAQGADTATADRLFREGRALMKQGSYEEACSKLEESHRLDPAPGTAINLGDCFEKQGKVASALLAYQAARDLLQPGDPRVHPVKQQLTALEKRTPKLTLRMSEHAPRGTRVARDGRKILPSQIGVPMPVNPGRHVVVVGAPEHKERRLALTLAEGETRELVVAPGDASLGVDPADPWRGVPAEGVTRPAESSARESQAGSDRQTIGYVSGGVGLVGLITGAVFLKLAADEEQEARARGKRVPTGQSCGQAPEPPACADVRAALEARDGNKSAATVSFVVGAVGIATAGVLLLWPDDKPNDTSLAPTLTLGRTGMATSLRGTF